MQIETTSQICPLCKRASAASNAHAPTRLCQRCCSMIETIMPGRASSNGATHASPMYATAAARQVEVAAPVEFETSASQSDPMPQDEDYEMVSLETTLDSRKDFLDEPEESFNQITEPAEVMIATPTLDRPSLDQSSQGAPAARVADTIAEAHRSPARIEVSAEPARTSEIIETPILPSAETRASFSPLALHESLDMQIGSAQAEDISSLKAAIDESAVDPWDDPLPAWEYSRNEWPIALVEEKPSLISRLKIPIALAVLIALVALLYFVVIKQDTAPPQEPIAVVTPEPSRPTENAVAPKPAETASNSAAPVATAPTTTALATNEKQEAPAPSPANDGDETKWRHSLQAMASQDAVEANQFADRLVRAGVPAYVVAADLGSRGKWYRVRVGRFATADEALRFASEARARAKAAGVSLRDLNLSEYEKP